MYRMHSLQYVRAQTEMVNQKNHRCKIPQKSTPASNPMEPHGNSTMQDSSKINQADPVSRSRSTSNALADQHTCTNLLLSLSRSLSLCLALPRTLSPSLLSGFLSRSVLLPLFSLALRSLCLTLLCLSLSLSTLTRSLSLSRTLVHGHKL